MKSINLTNCDEVALVSDEDYERVSKHRWRLMNHGYVATGSVENREGKTPRNDFALLHRFVLNLPQAKQPIVDHINKSKLDCTRENLRVVTQKENMQNSHGYGGGVKGVYALPYGRFRAMLRHEGELIHLGVFDTIEDAERARLAKEAELGWEYS